MKKGIHKAHPFIEQAVDTGRLHEPEEKLAISVFTQALKDIKHAKKAEVETGKMNFYQKIKYESAVSFLKDEGTIWHEILGIGRLNVEVLGL